MAFPQGLAFFALSMPEVEEVSQGLELLARLDCKCCPKKFPGRESGTLLC